MPLDTYKQKRNFAITPEPSGAPQKKKSASPKLQYVIQKHRATSLHYDFRLEHNGVLLSWAVPKGPSLDPSIKRLAMHVEDHPLEYGGFEGVIPEGEYGGGTVMLWDNGTWEPEVPDIDAALQKGDLKFTLHGKKLEGSWVLVHTRGFGGSQNSWLLIKHRDEFASTQDILTEKPRSVLSHRLLADIAKAGGGDMAKAATGDPPATTASVSSSQRGAARSEQANSTPADTAVPEQERSSRAKKSTARKHGASTQKPAASVDKPRTRAQKSSANAQKRASAKTRRAKTKP